MINKEDYLDNLISDEINSPVIAKIMQMKGGHQIKIDQSACCLLLLDMQNFFFDENSHAFIPSARSILPRVRKIMKVCQKIGIPVICTRHINDEKNAANMGTWWRDILVRENPFSELVTDLDIDPKTVIDKSQYDAFYNTDLENKLEGMGVKQVIIGGVMTHLCCETTAREAFVRGFEVFFGIDFTATYNREFHLSSLTNLSHGFAIPVTAEETIKIIKK